MKKAFFSIIIAVICVCMLCSCTSNKKSSPDNSAAGKIPDGKGVVYLTLVVHVEGWNDEGNKNIFNDHAKKLRSYAALFDKYDAKMTLEAKEIIDGCIRWNDNVLYELEQDGHAVGIHADVGGEKDATAQSMTTKLNEMKQKLARLGINARFVSGVASKADWITACKNSGFEAVTCMVNYGLWSLDPKLRPSYFEEYKTPAEGHGAYPEKIEDRLHAWYADNGSNWIKNSDKSDLLIIPSGLSLTNAYEELSENSNSVKTEFTQDDINAWKEALDKAIKSSDSHEVNTFYAVWSFGKDVDPELLEEWLKVVDTYVKQGKIEWKNMNEIIDIYENNR